MRKGFLVAAMALVVILAAGSVDAQQQVFWLAPGERVDYVGAVDDWTGSPAQRSLEGTRSLIFGPLRDGQRHMDAINGHPDSYYGSGVSPTSSPYRLGASAYDGGNYGYSNYGYDNRGYDNRGYDRGYRRSGGYSNGRYDNRSRNRGYDNRRNGYSRPATQADVRGWGVGNAVLTAGTFVAGEILAGKRDRQEDERHQEEMAALEALREERQAEQRRDDTPRRSESRAYYGSSSVQASRPAAKYMAVNDLGTDACINGTRIAHGERTPVSDPDNIDITPPPGKTICAAEAQFVSQDTILVTCKKGR